MDDVTKLHKTTAAYLQRFIEVVVGPGRIVKDVIVSDRYYKGHSTDDKEPINLMMSDNEVLRMKPESVALGAILWYYNIHNSRFVKSIDGPFANYLKEHVCPAFKPAEHHRVSCAECSMRPILGARYKCETCPADYSLCDKCAHSTFHVHPLTKIHDPRLVLSCDTEGRQYFHLVL